MKHIFRIYGVKVFWLVVNPIRYIYWFIVRPKTAGAKCLIENDGSFLLARISYDNKQWVIPGGGVNRGEKSYQAAIRETFEEVGILPEKVTKIGEYLNTRQYKIDTVHVYYYRAKSRDFTIDRFEIMEAGWFRYNEIPTNRAKSVDKVLNMYSNFLEGKMRPIEVREKDKPFIGEAGIKILSR